MGRVDRTRWASPQEPELGPFCPDVVLLFKRCVAIQAGHYTAGANNIVMVA